MGNVWQQPSPSDWDRWETLCRDLEPDKGPGDAARELGFKGSSVFKRNDPVRHAETIQRWRDDSKEADIQYVRATLRENIERAMTPTPILYQGKDTGYTEWAGPIALRAAELLGKDAGLFDQTQHVEITGAEGGPIEIEDRSASLADVARVLEAVGALTELSRGTAPVDVPAARRVLPAPPDR